MSISDEDWISAAEVAAMLGTSRTTVHRYAQSGVLFARVLPGGHRRFKRGHVRELIGERPRADADAIEAAVAELVARAPQLTDEQRDQLATLLAPVAHAANGAA